MVYLKTAAGTANADIWCGDGIINIEGIGWCAGMWLHAAAMVREWVGVMCRRDMVLLRSWRRV